MQIVAGPTRFAVKVTSMTSVSTPRAVATGVESQLEPRGTIATLPWTPTKERLVSVSTTAAKSG
jgi:hypothetical protein